MGESVSWRMHLVGLRSLGKRFHFPVPCLTSTLGKDLALVPEHTQAQITVFPFVGVSLGSFCNLATLIFHILQEEVKMLLSFLIVEEIK